MDDVEASIKYVEGIVDKLFTYNHDKHEYEDKKDELDEQKYEELKDRVSKIEANAEQYDSAIHRLSTKMDENMAHVESANEKLKSKITVNVERFDSAIQRLTNNMTALSNLARERYDEYTDNHRDLDERYAKLKDWMGDLYNIVQILDQQVQYATTLLHRQYPTEIAVPQAGERPQEPAPAIPGDPHNVYDAQVKRKNRNSMCRVSAEFDIGQLSD